MSNLPEPNFMPGQEVLIRGSIPARVDRVMYCQNTIRPIYKVEWWHEGAPQTWEVEEIDLTERHPARNRAEMKKEWRGPY